MFARFPLFRHLLVADDNQHGGLFGNVFLYQEKSSLRFLKARNLNFNLKVVGFSSFSGVFQRWLIALYVPDLRKLAILQLARTHCTHIISVQYRKLN